MSKPVHLKPPEPVAAPSADEAQRRDAGEELGGRLREMFRSIETAPLPDELRRVVEQLESARNGPRNPKRN